MVSEVHVAWRVEGVDHLVALVQADRLELDRDAPLPLDVHRVQELLLHVPGRHGARDLEQTVGQGGLAVVDVGDDRDVADAIERRAGRGHGDLTTLPTARIASPIASGAARTPRHKVDANRSEERRVGTECVSTGRSRWWPNHK